MGYQNVAALPMEIDGEIKVGDSSVGEKVARCNCCDAICGLSKQANHKAELESRSKSSRKLSGLIVFCLIFIVVEVVGGVKANSLAVLTDAAHLLTDVTGFALSLLAVWASGWDATPRHSFGFFRVEVLGALLSVQLIWLIVGFLIYEAIGRIWLRDVAVNGKIMFVTAAFGFFINLIMVAWLGHDHSHHGHDHGHSHSHHHGQDHDHHSHHQGHDHDHSHHHGHGHEEHSTHKNAEEKPLVSLKSKTENDHQCEDQVQKKSILHSMLLPLRLLKQSHINMNVQGAYLHVVGDLIQSVGVMIGGALIWAKPNWLVVDLVCTLVFSTLVLLTTVTMIRDILSILMEGTPREIDMAELESGLRCIRGVHAVHDLHVWAVSVSKILVSCHVTAEQGANSNEIIRQSRDYFENVYGIHHVTIQIEQD